MKYVLTVIQDLRSKDTPFQASVKPLDKEHAISYGVAKTIDEAESIAIYEAKRSLENRETVKVQLIDL